MAAILVFTPLITALIVGLLSSQINKNLAKIITCFGLIISAILSVIIFKDVVIDKNPQIHEMLRWIDVAGISVNWSLRIDSLTAVMLIVVTFVSSLVHIYSVSYMEKDDSIPRFMSYLSLFTFFMLMLVTSDNFVQLFLGWEGVGLCSYLLIGFWYKKDSAANAAMKAFIVNRIGDFGFALGIFAIYLLFGTVNYSEVFDLALQKQNATFNILGIEFHAITFICLLLFIGAMGKSAQLGLHTWLPDAMEGPTPVSALIHAATMVTAGVFLVARCSPLFELSPTALNFVTIIGGLTAVFAATVALTQNDIKRIIAYSTCSQLGYMFFACGVSAYSAGIFHLMTHAFFKALLFLTAGSVIHALSDEQDIRRMGGIWKKIPFTYAFMWIGSLALAGIFPFAGYYSKDIILESAFAAGGAGSFAYWLGLAAAFMTAFYSWRLLIIVFHGKPRADEHKMQHIHESPMMMLVPLTLLAIGAITSGFIGANILGMVEPGASFWNNAIYLQEGKNILHEAHNVPKIVKFSPLIAGISGIILAYFFYMYKPKTPILLANRFKLAYKISLNKWYFDEIYDRFIVKKIKSLGRFLWKNVDIQIIDALGPDGVASLSQKVSKKVRALQSGYVFTYAFVMIFSLMLLLTWFIYTYIKL